MIRWVPFVLLGLLVLPVLARAAPQDAEHPGRLLNLAQQHLARGEIDEAIDALERSIEGNPAEGYAWGLLADALVWGRGHGPELEASWEALASLSPGDPHRPLRVVRARMATHRLDKFTNADTDWIIASTELIDEVLEEASTAEVRYAALIARRDLRYRAGLGTEALADGVAAHEVSPTGLQGRISAVQRASSDHDVTRFESLCLDILETDPWAAEVCSLLWTGTWADDVEPARERVQARIEGLFDRAIDDPVLANEILKFYDRRKQPAGGARLLVALRKKLPDFKVADNSRWYRGSFVVPPAYRTLFADTNRAHNTDDPAVRLTKLLALAPPNEDGHPMVQRWRWRVVEAAKAIEPPDEAELHRQLLLLVEHDPADARAWVELSSWELGAGARSPDAFVEADLVRDAALDALLRAEDAALSEGWDPWEKYGRLPFAEAMARRRHYVAELHLRRALLHAEGGDAEGAWSLALQAAWSSDHTSPGAWELVARLAAMRGELAFAREADVEHVAALLEQGDATPDAAADALGRFIAARPELHDGDPGAAWHALVAAANVRRAEGGDPSSPSAGRKEQHPFVGKSAPELAVTSLAGAARTLTDLRGQIVVVDFWATWCAPCKKAMPELQSAADALSGEPVTFLLVSVDANLEEASEYWSEAELSMDAVWSPDGKAAQADWRVKGIPSTFVVDREGVVRHHHQGFRKGEGRVIEAEIRALLSSL